MATPFSFLFFLFFFFFFAASENVFCSLGSKILWKWQQRFPENIKLEHKENLNLRCFVNSRLEHGLHCVCAIVLIHTYLQKIDTFQIIANRMTNFVNSTL